MKFLVLLLAVGIAQSLVIPKDWDLNEIYLKTPMVGGTKDNPIITWPKITLKEALASGRIIGGNEVTPHSVPYQAAVRASSPTGGWFCGGSLISTNRVLTAAHCCDGASSIQVVLGAHNVNNAESTQVKVTVPGSNIIGHPQYNPNLLHNDICVLQLPSNVQLDANIQTVRIDGANAVDTHAGKQGRVSGWGKPSDASSSINPTLKEAYVSVITNAVCRSTYGNTVDNGCICTRFVDQGTCNGDSGGPLVIFDANNVPTQIGVVSFVSSLGCESGNPDGYGRVGNFADWINQQ